MGQQNGKGDNGKGDGFINSTAGHCSQSQKRVAKQPPHDCGRWVSLRSSYAARAILRGGAFSPAVIKRGQYLPAQQPADPRWCVERQRLHRRNTTRQGSAG
jgi:hypothetical protein